jgi:hypothetical protein
VAPPRQRRGVLNILQSDWRRSEPGSNHITSFGVWKMGARREVPRPNRTGATLWHRPRRSLGTTNF